MPLFQAESAVLEGSVSFSITIPATEWYRRQIIAALLLLTDETNWIQQPGDEGDVEAAVQASLVAIETVEVV